jgi:excisionase family DNA binding protein
MANRLPAKSLSESAGRRGGGSGGTRADRVPPPTTRNTDTGLLLRPSEVAKMLGLSRSKVFELLAAQELPSVHIGRCTRVPREQLQKWIQAQIRWQPRAAVGLLGRIQSSMGSGPN